MAWNFSSDYLGEDVGPRRVGAAMVGFVGVLCVIQPSFAAFGAVALFPLGTAVGFAFYILVTRGLSRRMHPVALQFHTGLIASLLCLPVMILAEGTGSAMLDPVWPQGINWIWLFGVGFFATLSHMMMTYALSLAPSATLAPLQYLELPVATLLGYLVFRDFPNAMALAGIAIIIGAGLYMIHRERVTLGPDTQYRVALDHQDGADAALAHAPRGLVQWHVGCALEQIATDDLTDGHLVRMRKGKHLVDLRRKGFWTVHERTAPSGKADSTLPTTAGIHQDLSDKRSHCRIDAPRIRSITSRRGHFTAR